MLLNSKFFIILGITISVYACSKKSEEPVSAQAANYGPVLPETPYDYMANPLLDFGFGFNLQINNDIITLGRVLFYDKALSFNNNISCGSCHFQDKGFADNVQFHKGVFGNTLKRNTLSITGNAFNMFWDGRAKGMKELVLKPIANHDEMVQDPQALISKLKQINYYQKLFMNAYNSNVIDLKGVENALAAFCVAILPNNTKFDKGIDAFAFSGMGTNTDLSNSNAKLYTLNSIENQGMNLFFGKARCATCHHPQEGGTTYGGFSTTTTFANIGLDIEYADKGLGSLTNVASNNGKFKIPNLKNVALTAPYMHDGRFKTLEEVVDHYNAGIKPSVELSPKLYSQALTPDEIMLFDEQNIIPLVQNTNPVRLGLTADEKVALVAFLKTLTDEELMRDIKFSNPF
jgi:cytochrome c peroxidase